jgi:hypothetical protein
MKAGWLIGVIEGKLDWLEFPESYAGPPSGVRSDCPASQASLPSPISRLPATPPSCRMALPDNELSANANESSPRNHHPFAKPERTTGGQLLELPKSEWRQALDANRAMVFARGPTKRKSGRSI